MKSISLRSPWHSMMAAFLIPLLAFLLACGPGEEPTPIPTATPTQAAIPGEGPVATPTPTTEAAPVSTPSEKPKYGGRFLWVTGNATQADYDVHNGDPNGGGIAQWINSTMLDPVQSPEADREGLVECSLCTDWHLENGGKTMVFNMKQGVKYHDGTEMTSADVAYSYKKAMGQIDGLASTRSGVLKEFVTSIETPSRYQIKLHMSRPSAVFIPKVLAYGFTGVMPEGTTRAMLKEKPYGSGPYVVKKVIPGASVAFDRNPNYYKPGLPYMDGIDLVVVGDVATREATFLTGKQLAVGLFAPQHMALLEGLVAQGKMNLSINRGGCGTAGVQWVNSKPPFDDIRVRKAINLSLDRKALALVAVGGELKYAVPHLYFFGRGMKYATPEDQIWDVAPGWGTGAKKQQEIVEAQKLMVDAGYANGFDTTVLTNTIQPFGVYSLSPVVSQQLGKIGIRAKIQEVTANQRTIKMEALDYEMASHSGGCVTTREPDDLVGQFWVTGASRNNSGVSSPIIDSLFIQMTGEPEYEKRAEIFFKIQDLVVMEQVWYAPFSREDTWVWSWASFKDYYTAFDGMNFAGRKFDRVWIDN